MEASIAVVALWAEDVQAAAHFYRDVIGLPLAVHSEDRPHFRAGEALSGDHSWMALTFHRGLLPRTIISSMKRILLVDDDALLRRSLAYNLERAGYSTRAAGSAEDGLKLVRQEKPDLVLLDIGLPGMDGLEALRQLRDQIGVPVILLTARRRELDEVLGLELGADDYVTKPFDLDVLLAHIKAVLRRAGSTPEGGTGPAAGNSPVHVGDLSIDPAAHTATLAGHPLVLSPREFDLLYALCRSAGQVISTEDLLTQVWGDGYEGQPQVVYVHVRWLREKIEADPTNPQRILTVRGLGYKLIPSPGSVSPGSGRKGAHAQPA